MRLPSAACLVLGLVGAAPLAAAERVDFKYAVGTDTLPWKDRRLPRGFDFRGDALRVQLRRPAHLYLLVEYRRGEVRMAWPDPTLPGLKSARLPRKTMVRIDAAGTVARRWLVVATEAVPELEAHMLKGAALLPSDLPRGLVERYSASPRLQRFVRPGGVTVRLAAADEGPTVVIEEVASAPARGPASLLQ